jgi:hypothetical protein
MTKVFLISLLISIGIFILVKPTPVAGWIYGFFEVVSSLLLAPSYGLSS